MDPKNVDPIETEDDTNEQTETDEDSTPESVPEGSVQFVDVIDLKADDLIDSKNIVSLKMPKVTVEMINGRPQVARSNLMIALNDNPKVCSNLIAAANKGVMSFVLTTYMDVEKTEVCDVWELEGARIVGIDFGEVVTIPQPEQRVVQCEIEFTKLIVNGVKI